MTREPKRIPFDELAGNLATVFDRIVGENETVVVEKGGKEVVLMTLVRPTKTRRVDRTARVPRAAQVARSREGIVKAAGSWADVDVEGLKAYFYERRRNSSRPPVRL